MNGSLARARQLVDALRGVEVEPGRPLAAVCDVTDATGNLPCVLVPPPRLAFDLGDGATATWRLVALAADGTGSAIAWQQLDELVDAVAGLLPIELAEPTSYQLPNGADAVPAYVLTFSEAID